MGTRETFTSGAATGLPPPAHGPQRRVSGDGHARITRDTPKRLSCRLALFGGIFDVIGPFSAKLRE